MNLPPKVFCLTFGGKFTFETAPFLTALMLRNYLFEILLLFFALRILKYRYEP